MVVITLVIPLVITLVTRLVITLVLVWHYCAGSSVGFNLAIILTNEKLKHFWKECK